MDKPRGSVATAKPADAPRAWKDPSVVNVWMDTQIYIYIYMYRVRGNPGALRTPLPGPGIDPPRPGNQAPKGFNKFE